MQVSALQCPRCFAPVAPVSGPVSVCRYCGTTLAIQGAAPVMAPLVAPVQGVFLESAGDNVIHVIKVVREHTGLGLKESKDLVDRAPCVVAEWNDPPRLERFRQDLVRAGARVR